LITKLKKNIALLLISLALLSLFGVNVLAKTIPGGQTVGNVLFYITNSTDEQILVSQIPVSEMESDMKAGKIDTTNHNYSILDRYVTTVHQEGKGFTVPEFVAYAQGKSSLSALRSLNLTFAGKDVIRFWEIDQTGYDDLDTYTCDELYGIQRYNFPLLYKYWNYKTQDYYDPDGKMTRDETIDFIFQNGEPEICLLSVRAFSQRYIITDSKYGTGDYNLENYWQSQELMDNKRTMRILKPMTKEELYNKLPTAADTRYWVANILLNMNEKPDIKPLGTVEAPTAVMTEDENNYYIRFSCGTKGATIYYNHNYISPSYTPTCPYEGTAAVVPKTWFPSGEVIMTCRAVKEGWLDKGVVALKLTSSGSEGRWVNPYTDVSAKAWYYDNVRYVTENGLFDAISETNFSPDAPLTRSMLVAALYRLAGSPPINNKSMFSDVSDTAAYAHAVAWAYENGIVNGTGGDRFSPEGSITREQITAMFYRYALKIAGADTAASDTLASFTDKEHVSGWANEAVSWAVGAGLINGTTATTLSPQGTATRAQAAAMVLRLAVFTGM
jgi:hypothetical protein